MKAKRIVFKVGTSSLTNADGSLSRAKVKEITRQLALLHEAGHELILVSSGAVAAGFSSLGFKKRPTKVADKQASAAVGQGLLLEEYTTNLLLKQIISAQILLTQDDFADKRRYKNAHQALSVLLNRGAIPIINENDSVAIEELKVGDNDTLSAQVAAMVQADLLVLLTDVDGLYTANPSTNPDARRLEKIEKISSELIDMAGGAGSSNGTGGMLTKIKGAPGARHGRQILRDHHRRGRRCGSVGPGRGGGRRAGGPDRLQRGDSLSPYGHDSRADVRLLLGAGT